MAKPFNQNAVIRGALRRTFSRAPVKQEVLRAVRKEFPKFNKDGSRSKKDSVCYLCAVCNEYKGSTKVSVDHIIPVISVDNGFIDWNVFIERLYCGKENLQVICDDCHKIKTAKERFERTYKAELAQLKYLESAIKSSFSDISKEDVKFLKRFTPKRLTKYPPEFVELALYLKKRIK